MSATVGSGALLRHDFWTASPLLMLCEASAEVADLPVLNRIAELREGGRSLFGVAAGRWST